MFAPSTTYRQPLRASARAAAPSSSFCVALGMATSHATSQMLPPETKCALSTRSA